MGSLATGVLATLGMLLALSVPVRAEPAVTGRLQLSQNGDETLLEFTSEAATPFRVFTLDAPMRIIVDFAGLAWPDIPPGPFSAEPIAGLRYGLFSPGWSRLVLDLDRPLRVTRAVFQPGADGARFSLSLTEIPAEEFSALVGPPPPSPWQSQAASDDPVPPVAKTERRPGDPLIVVIDPGHGGIDPGAVRGDLMEKEITLRAARILVEALRDSGRYRPILTRDADVFLPLAERVRIARDGRADAFISLHVNTESTGRADGVSISTLSETASDEAAGRLAALENRADLLAGLALEGEGSTVTRVLFDLAQSETNQRSRQMALSIVRVLEPGDLLIRSNPHRSAGFMVLRAPDIPSILVELGFLTHSEDRARLTSDAWLKGLAADLVTALDDWAAADLEARRSALR